MNRKIKIGFTTLLLSGALSGQAFFERAFLPQPDNHNGRALALGGVSEGSAGNSDALTVNPALLLAEGEGLTIFAKARGRQLKERRSYPVVDTFNDFLADNVYVSNTTVTGDGGFGLTYSSDKWAVAASYTLNTTSNYDYKEEVRSSGYDYNRDPLAGYHAVEFASELQNMSFGAAYTIWKSWQAGFAISILSGGNLSDGFGVIPIRKEPRLASQDSTFFPSEYSIDAVSDYHFGFSGELTSRLKLNASISLPGELTQHELKLITVMDSTLLLPNYQMLADTFSTAVVQRPAVYRLGLRFIPENMLRTAVYAQVDFTDWSGYQIDYEDSQIEDFKPGYTMQTTVRAGMEHLFHTGIPMRLGLSYINHPSAATLNESIISFGSGYQSDKISLDVGAAISENSYRYNDLFPVTGEIRENKDTVRQSNILINLSLQYRW